MPDQAQAPSEPQTPSGECLPLPEDFDPDVEGTCYSARKCGGKVLTPKSARSCKRAGGKSWRSPSGQCYDL